MVGGGKGCWIDVVLIHNLKGMINPSFPFRSVLKSQLTFALENPMEKIQKSSVAAIKAFFEMDNKEASKEIRALSKEERLYLANLICEQEGWEMTSA